MKKIMLQGDVPCFGSDNKKKKEWVDFSRPKGDTKRERVGYLTHVHGGVAKPASEEDIQLRDDIGL